MSPVKICIFLYMKPGDAHYMRLILSLIIFTCLHGNAQTNLLNRSSRRLDSKFVLKEVSNVFEVTGSKNAKWRLTAKYAKITATDSPWLFKVESFRLGADTFFLSRNGTIMLTKIFYVIPISPPYAHWGVLKKNTATKEEVIAYRRMVVSLRECDNCVYFKVFDFSIQFITDQFPEYQKTIKVQGHELNQEAASLIAKLIHGDKVVFDHILVEARDARIREIPGFAIVIK
jgi:hypothetical protein